MTKKFSKYEFLQLFSAPAVARIGTEVDKNDPNVTSNATKRGHKHQHNPAAKPSTGKITPAQYRRKSKQLHAAVKQLRTEERERKRKEQANAH